MPMELTPELRAWLEKHGLGGFLKIAEAKSHPNGPEVGEKIEVVHLPKTKNQDILGLKMKVYAKWRSFTPKYLNHIRRVFSNEKGVLNARRP